MTETAAATRVRLWINDGIAHIELIRPQAANAIDLAFALELEAAAQTVAGLRAVLITAQGSRFCVGGDLKSFAAQASMGEHLREVTLHLHHAVVLLAESDAPVVVAVQGAAAGAGLGLVCCADLVIAAESAKFVMAYTGVGLSPDGSTSFFLPALVGARLALDMALTNRPLSAAEALAAGLVSRVVPDEGLFAAGQRLVEALAAGPSGSLATTKRLMRRELAALRHHLDREREELGRMADSTDGREGVRAFVERRAPSFGVSQTPRWGT